MSNTSILSDYLSSSLKEVLEAVKLEALQQQKEANLPKMVDDEAERRLKVIRPRERLRLFVSKDTRTSGLSFTFINSFWNKNL